MGLRYIFRDLDEKLIATVETDHPIVHLAIGTNLVLSTDKDRQDRETWLRVEHIMVGLTHGTSGSTQNLVGVICSIQSTQSTTVAQGHTPNSYQDMIGDRATHS